MESEEAKWKITDAVKGKRAIQYKLRDWLISRQRYWGAPIPIIYCDKCGEQPVKEEDLPVTLPDDVDFRPKGESPLVRSESFHNITCPECGASARRESDTMDTFVDSSWYFLRYTDPRNQEEFASKKKLKAWLPVDTYVGGAEHAVLHLLYARFVTMALHDLGHLTFEEPFLKLRNQGLILGPDGQKMSKSRGNVINPDDVIEQFGADCMRMYEMFMGPLEDAKPWDTNGIVGVRRFLERVWNSREFVDTEYLNDEQELSVGRELAKTIKKAEDDIQSFGFNTAVAQFMIFINAVHKVERISTHDWETFLKVLSPFAPHITNELWEMLGHKNVIEKEKWPQADVLLLAQDEVTYAVQVNGKLRGNVVIQVDASEGEVVKAAKQDANVAKHMEGGEIVKQVFVEHRLINFVVK
ncbi:MAG: class I tRNA ligase family protein [Patescibacteria group bacterium]